MQGLHLTADLFQCTCDQALMVCADTIAQLCRSQTQASGLTLVDDKWVKFPEWQGQPEPLPAEHRMRLAELKAQKRFILGYAGGHGLANALDYLLQAASLIRQDPALADKLQVVLVGDGPDKAALVQQAQALGLDNVSFLPAIAKRAVPAFLAECDALYIGWRKLPIYRFGINPNKLFDYMMAARPVLHSVEAGNDPVLEAGCGLTVPPADPKAIAQGLLQLAQIDTDTRKRMGAQGRQFVLDNHTYPVLAARFLQACQSD